MYFHNLKIHMFRKFISKYTRGIINSVIVVQFLNFIRNYLIIRLLKKNLNLYLNLNSYKNF
jgi:hypothetical protein